MSDDQPVQEYNELSQDSKNIGLMLWVGTIFLGFIPGLILYFVKQDDEFIFDQAKEALNWSITTMAAYFVAWILIFVVIGALLLPVVGLVHIVVCVLGALAVSKGTSYRAPFAIRLIK